MSYAQAIDELKAVLEASPTPGLTYTTDPRAESLSEVDSQAGFDGSFLLSNEKPGQPWPELTEEPEDWTCTVRLEIGTLLKESVLQQDKLVEQRAQDTYKALMFGSFTYADVYEWGEPAKERSGSDRRIVWAVTFKMRYPT